MLITDPVEAAHRARVRDQDGQPVYPDEFKPVKATGYVDSEIESPVEMIAD